jgi:hypothetical protein
MQFNLNEVQATLNHIKMMQGKQLAIQNESRFDMILNDINKAEFKVFSQWGDDGIIQFLISYLSIDNKIFIEFGVENYLESNTRFLLLNNCWKGFIMDGSSDNINQIKNSNIYWQFHLEAQCQFITKENINALISSYTKIEEIGLLVIDIDGNDYWIWKHIDVIKPVVVIVEYNSLFGQERAITIPYKSDFNRTKAHFSNLYYGSSLAALVELGYNKGYNLVACNNHGNNAYFVRNDKMKQLKKLTINQAYKQATFRESRNQENRLNYLNFEEAQQTIKGIDVINISNNQAEPF